ncbi:MAG: hypothetical protein GXZ05_09560 [Gammaproteobacteria bacterium]|nr:hypothetical protein [Gammaproteobacteria bacterium]
MNKYPPRPKVTRAIILKVAAETARELRWPEDSAECIADAYVGYGPDGFRIAKELDRDGWDLHEDDIEVFGGMRWKINHIALELEKAWVEENNIQPPLEIGAEIAEGIITGICKNPPGRYEVREHGCTDDNRRLLVKFEDAQEQGE